MRRITTAFVNARTQVECKVIFGIERDLAFDRGDPARTEWYIRAGFAFILKENLFGICAYCGTLKLWIL